MKKSNYYFLLLFFVCSSLLGQRNTTQFTGVKGCYPKTISINAHVLLDNRGESNSTFAELNDAITLLNQYFEPICVQFNLCLYDSIPNLRHDEIIQGLTDEELTPKFDIPNTINFYLVQSYSPIERVFALLGDTIEPEISSNRDAFFVVKSFLSDQKSLAKAMGKYFGLLTTNGVGGELVDGSNCSTTGDYICDTPADPDANLDLECTLLGDPTDANGDYYTPVFCNIMSGYSVCTDPSKYHFTNGQYNRMLEVITKGRSYLW